MSTRRFYRNPGEGGRGWGNINAKTVAKKRHQLREAIAETKDDIEMHIGDFEDMPLGIKRYLWHTMFPNNAQRFAIVCFLMGHDVPDIHIKRLFQRYFILHPDQSAHVDWILEHKGANLGRWHYWDVFARRSQYLDKSPAPYQFQGY